jgi:pimeloyl-ACP methyl ester carboxylesterase
MLFSQKKVQGFLLSLLLVVSFAVGLAIHHSDAVTAQPLAQTSSTKPAIVLVHGAFADGSSWQRVIPLLERDGYTVTAVQNPLTSLPDDVTTTKRVIDAQKGSVVVVGHSYGGTVITGAAAGNPQVKALVYIAAYAPEAGETISALSAKYAPPPLASALVPDAAGFLYVDRSKLHDVFAKDLPTAEARVLAATQKPLVSAAFNQAVNSAAWKTIPSWYLVAQEDRAINPDLERFMAKRIGAQTTEIKASHVPFLSHPNEVAELIETAATAK